jgi:competence protein ComEA
MPEGSRHIAVIWALAAVLATLALVRLLGGEDGSAAPAVRIDGSSAAGPTSAGESAGQRGEGAGGRSIYIHVAGAVRRPGLFRLRDGSRAAMAIERAGGPLRRADLTGVNLAARLADGQQIVVPRAGATAVVAGAPAGAAGAAAGAATGAMPGAKLSLAGATIDQLEELDGIGPTLAQRIIEYRDGQGGLRSLEELREVEGIGEKRFASLREALQP